MTVEAPLTSSAPAGQAADGSGPAVGTSPSTASGPTVRTVGRQARGPLLALLAIVAAAMLTALLAAGQPGRPLDPDSVSPSGSRAVAEVLRDGEVPVRRVETVEEVVAAGAESATVVVAEPSALVDGELRRLGALASALVVVGPDDEQLEALGLPVEVQGMTEVEERQPGCGLDVARRAGEAELGGVTYASTGGAEATGCYAASGDASLLRLPGRGVTLVGDGSLLSNDRLDESGNASLALGLLSERGGEVIWLVPRPGRPLPPGERPSLTSLLPDGLLLGVLQLFLAVGVLALWRARRLGRVVEEPLPVVVRAAEAVEGRSRLYRAAGARGAAAEALRAASRERLARVVGLAGGADRRSLSTLVAERTGRDPVAVDALLYGGAPPDDPALVRLVAELRTLETAVLDR